MNILVICLSDDFFIKHLWNLHKELGEQYVKPHHFYTYFGHLVVILHEICNFSVCCMCFAHEYFSDILLEGFCQNHYEILGRELGLHYVKFNYLCTYFEYQEPFYTNQAIFHFSYVLAYEYFGDNTSTIYLQNLYEHSVGCWRALPKASLIYFHIFW